MTISRLCQSGARRGRPFVDARWENARMGAETPRVRIDKWLWAARFFKTRALASEAVQGGRVHVGGQRIKPARDVRIGETIEITRPGSAPMYVVVRAISAARGPATTAQGLYEETPESRVNRERDAEVRRMAPAPPGAGLSGRPTKRDRRRYDDARRAGGS